MEQLELGENTDVVYLGMAKALEKVDHRILMDKIKSLGISSKVLKWLHCFLENKYQILTVNGTQSRRELQGWGVEKCFVELPTPSPKNVREFDSQLP